MARSIALLVLQSLLHTSIHSRVRLACARRYLTDVVFGNRHGMMTVRPRPLTREGEPLGVFVARRIEEHFVASWLAAGHKPPPHPLIAALSDEQLARLIVAPASGSTA